MDKWCQLKKATYPGWLAVAPLARQSARRDRLLSSGMCVKQQRVGRALCQTHSNLELQEHAAARTLALMAMNCACWIRLRLALEPPPPDPPPTDALATVPPTEGRLCHRMESMVSILVGSLTAECLLHHVAWIERNRFAGSEKHDLPPATMFAMTTAAAAVEMASANAAFCSTSAAAAFCRPCQGL